MKLLPLVFLATLIGAASVYAADFDINFGNTAKIPVTANISIENRHLLEPQSRIEQITRLTRNTLDLFKQPAYYKGAHYEPMVSKDMIGIRYTAQW